MDTQDTATRLADFALLDLDLRAGIVRLHDEIRVYLGRTLLDEAALHARLVDRLGNPKEIQDPYALRWLPNTRRKGLPHGLYAPHRQLVKIYGGRETRLG